MSMIYSTTDVLSLGSWPILFKVLTLSVTICTVALAIGLKCSPMVRETRVQSQVVPYQRLKNGT